jgi:hypothetical protein
LRTRSNAFSDDGPEAAVPAVEESAVEDPAVEVEEWSLVMVCS